MIVITQLQPTARRASLGVITRNSASPTPLPMPTAMEMLPDEHVKVEAALLLSSARMCRQLCNPVVNPSPVASRIVPVHRAVHGRLVQDELARHPAVLLTPLRCALSIIPEERHVCLAHKHNARYLDRLPHVPLELVRATVFEDGVVEAAPMGMGLHDALEDGARDVGQRHRPIVLWTPDVASHGEGRVHRDVPGGALLGVLAMLRKAGRVALGTGILGVHAGARKDVAAVVDAALEDLRDWRQASWRALLPALQEVAPEVASVLREKVAEEAKPGHVVVDQRLEEPVHLALLEALEAAVVAPDNDVPSLQPVLFRHRQIVERGPAPSQHQHDPDDLLAGRRLLDPHAVEGPRVHRGLEPPDERRAGALLARRFPDEVPQVLRSHPADAVDQKLQPVREGLLRSRTLLPCRMDRRLEAIVQGSQQHLLPDHIPRLCCYKQL
mmetsp:Transcript_107940/g.262124  ORF Transcript_107940/g.262124 Transcript_107940/m.262124 type:complete len:441 (-) Transcript_107940:113-1435(-)